MERREMMGILGAGAAGLVAMGGTAALAQGQGKAQAGAHEGHHGHEGQQIMDECARVCNETAAHCLHQAHQGGEGQHAHLRVHEAAMDCQAFCHLTSALMARNSKMAAYAHAACADACRDCARACDQGQDEVMKRCAEVCRRCEQHCRQQAKPA